MRRYTTSVPNTYTLTAGVGAAAPAHAAVTHSVGESSPGFNVFFAISPQRQKLEQPKNSTCRHQVYRFPILTGAPRGARFCTEALERLR